MTPIPPSQLTIKQATPSQIELSRRLTWAEWNRGRSVEEYLREYAETDQCSFSTNDRYLTWVLVPRDDSDTLAFLSSCETYRRKIVVKHDSGTKEAVGYGIASVFTRPDFRGKGYATHLMRLLHWVLAPHELLPRFPFEIWGSPPSQTLGDATVSVLYSDVGGFYERCGPTPETPGWISTARYSTVWPVNADNAVSRPTKVRWLEEHSLMPLLHQDDRLIIKDLATSSTDEPRFTFLPGDGQLEFQTKRYIVSLGDAEIKFPKYFGVTVAGEESESKLAYGAWTFELKPEPSRLIICRLRATLESFPTILDAVLSEARKVGVEIVEVWNLPSELQKAVEETGGRTFEREDHWPCLVWYGINAAPDSIDWKQIIKWDNNEK
ncbi:hypothetical protein FS837_011118 [Tulasnella sp. UAMH 9824]|nr:hypothetical protein FS837_011118 [Tulasnella sp. UAMH 9824]